MTKQVWREMKVGGQPTGQHSVSYTGSLHFAAYISYIDFGADEGKALARYTIDGDQIDYRQFETMEEALTWLTKEFDEAKRLNFSM